MKQSPRGNGGEIKGITIHVEKQALERRGDSSLILAILRKEKRRKRKSEVQIKT